MFSAGTLSFDESERALTNYLHLCELLQEEAGRGRVTLAELCFTLQGYIEETRQPRGRDGDVQRLETERDAVQIMTIHKAKGLEAAVVFAVNHQSHFDVPAVLMALPPRLRYAVAPAMAKEFFKAHFFPQQFTRKEFFTNSLNYYLSSLFFNAFPLPQREAGARQALRYAGELVGDGYSVLIFPEGRRTKEGDIAPFQPGVGMMASRLDVPVVPVRIDGLDKVLHPTWKMARPGRVRVIFGRPMQLSGDNYGALARQVLEPRVERRPYGQ